MNRPELNNPNAYHPYEMLAEEAMKHDIDSAEFLFSLFPDATMDDFDKFRAYLVGIHHSGIETGLLLSANDPMSAFEAYKFGVSEGRDQTLEDIRKLGGEI